MLAEIYEHRSTLPLKIYLVSFLLAIAVYFPIRSARSSLQIFHSQNKFINNLKTIQQSQSELSFLQFASLLNQTVYQGKWRSSLKSSRLLMEEEGVFQIRITSKTQEEKKATILLMKLYDGEYEEDGYYQIEIKCDSLITEAKINQQKIVYESTQPVIGEYQKHIIFKRLQKQRIFINKLKFFVSFNNASLKLSMILAAEYDINIIVESLLKEAQFFNNFFLSLLIVFCLVLQILGILQLYEQISLKTILRKGISTETVLLTILWDTCFFLVLIKLCLLDELNFAIFSLPLGLNCLMVFILEFKLLFALQDETFFHYQHETTKYILIMVGIVIFYLSNLHWIIFILYSAALLAPQIILNFKLGHKIKYAFSPLIKLIFPRFLILFYVRLYDGNMFHLKPDYLLCLGCLMIVLISVVLLSIQKKYGSRSILPTFLIPKKFQEFKFFMNEEESTHVECSICLTSLNLLPETQQMKIEEKIYNRVIVTPCKHKFHFYCLENWMESKLQCPNCRTILPPIDQQ